MATLADVPTELHRQIVKDMVTITVQNWTPRLVGLAGLSPYWQELVTEVIGRRVWDLWEEEERKVERRESAPNPVQSFPFTCTPAFHYGRCHMRRQEVFEKKRLSRLERVLQKVVGWHFPRVEAIRSTLVSGLRRQSRDGMQHQTKNQKAKSGAIVDGRLTLSTSAPEN